ncbi:MAG: SAM-dependent DNA methyltransferase, partial [Nitrospiraceae bacterium]
FKPYAGVKTGVLIFRWPTDPKAKKTNKVWFYDMRADGYDPDKIVGGGRPETPNRNDIPDLLTQWARYKKSGYKEPPGVEAGTLLEPGTQEPRCWWALLKSIAENDYNLAAGRYK